MMLLALFCRVSLATVLFCQVFIIHLGFLIVLQSIVFSVKTIVFTSWQTIDIRRLIKFKTNCHNTCYRCSHSQLFINIVNQQSFIYILSNTNSNQNPKSRAKLFESWQIACKLTRGLVVFINVNYPSSVKLLIVSLCFTLCIVYRASEEVACGFFLFAFIMFKCSG